MSHRAAPQNGGRKRLAYHDIMSAYALVDRYPLEGDLRESVRINWLFSHWCNYQCDYCGVLVFSRRTAEKQVHAFDHHTAEEWLAAFLRIPRNHIVLKVHGGEPFMDRESWRHLLAGLLADPRFELDVFTNASWNPDYYRGIPHLDRLRLIISYHPSQTRLEPWRERVRRIRDAGFTILTTLTVLAPENLVEAERYRDAMATDGMPFELRPMIPAGVYMYRPQTELEIESEFTPAMAWMYALRYQTKGMPCYYPAVTYELSYDGRIRPACLDVPSASFVHDPLPALPAAAVRCPLDKCEGCMEMAYSMPENPFVPRPLSVTTRTAFAAEVRRHAAAAAADPDHLRATMSAARMPGSDKDCYQAFMERLETPAAPAFDIPAGGIFQALPDTPVVGYIDEFTTPLTARATDRIPISGWAFQQHPAGPVRSLRIQFNGATLAEFADFGPRPELPTIFGKPEMLRAGFGGLLYLPSVRPGEYELAAFAVASDGSEHPLPPRPVVITA
jgi:hypothetical protein